MNISKNFVVQEFICPEIYKIFGDNSIWFLERKIVNVVQFMREKIGKPITINNWHNGGQYKESGLRDFTTQTGSGRSQHKYGKAADIKINGMNPAEIFEWINKNWVMLSSIGLTTVEDVAMTPTWNHLDTRWTGLSSLLIVKP